MDRFGEPILYWDEMMNRVSISSMHPSWVEGESVNSAAFNLTFGLNISVSYLLASNSLDGRVLSLIISPLSSLVRNSCGCLFAELSA